MSIRKRMREDDADDDLFDRMVEVVQGVIRDVTSRASRVAVGLRKRIRVAQRGCDDRRPLVSVQERLLAPSTRKPRYADKTGMGARRRGWQRSTWNDYMLDNVINDPDCVLHIEFRAKFRLPMKLFLPLLDRTRRSELFPNELERKAGAPAVPLHLKLMATLRVHALGCSFEGVEEAACVSSSVIRVFALGWWEWFVDTQYALHVYPPRNAAELKAAENLFSPLPFPGMYFPPRSRTSRPALHTRSTRAPHVPALFAICRLRAVARCVPSCVGQVPRHGAVAAHR